VNLIAELWLGLNSVKDPDDKKQIIEFGTLHTELTNGLGYLTEVFTTLIGPGGPKALFTIAEDKAATYVSSKLVSTLKTILKTIDPHKELEDPKWRYHWALMLLCSAAKEFSYTCRATDIGDVHAILSKTTIDNISVSELSKAVGKFMESKPGSLNQKGNYMRHFIAARLLSDFADALHNRPDPDA
jgi:hypothetical protein